MSTPNFNSIGGSPYGNINVSFKGAPSVVLPNTASATHSAANAGANVQNVVQPKVDQFDSAPVHTEAVLRHATILFTREEQDKITKSKKAVEKTLTDAGQKLSLDSANPAQPDTTLQTYLKLVDVVENAPAGLIAEATKTDVLALRPKIAKLEEFNTSFSRTSDAYTLFQQAMHETDFSDMQGGGIVVDKALKKLSPEETKEQITTRLWERIKAEGSEVVSIEEEYSRLTDTELFRKDFNETEGHHFRAAFFAYVSFELLRKAEKELGTARVKLFGSKVNNYFSDVNSARTKIRGDIVALDPNTHLAELAEIFHNHPELFYRVNNEVINNDIREVLVRVLESQHSDYVDTVFRFYDSVVKGEQAHYDRQSVKYKAKYNRPTDIQYIFALERVADAIMDANSHKSQIFYAREESTGDDKIGKFAGVNMDNFLSTLEKSDTGAEKLATWARPGVEKAAGLALGLSGKTIGLTGKVLGSGIAKGIIGGAINYTDKGVWSAVKWLAKIRPGKLGKAGTALGWTTLAGVSVASAGVVPVAVLALRGTNYIVNKLIIPHGGNAIGATTGLISSLTPSQQTTVNAVGTAFGWTTKIAGRGIAKASKSGHQSLTERARMHRSTTMLGGLTGDPTLVSSLFMEGVRSVGESSPLTLDGTLSGIKAITAKNEALGYKEAKDIWDGWKKYLGSQVRVFALNSTDAASQSLKTIYEGIASLSLDKIQDVDFDELISQITNYTDWLSSQIQGLNNEKQRRSNTIFTGKDTTKLQSENETRLAVIDSNLSQYTKAEQKLSKIKAALGNLAGSLVSYKDQSTKGAFNTHLTDFKNAFTI